MPVPVSLQNGSSGWKGRFSELVYSAEDYPVILTVQDVLGNVAVVRDTIPVDVLVLRDGDKLKIQIANINFAPNSSEFEHRSGHCREEYLCSETACSDTQQIQELPCYDRGTCSHHKFADPKLRKKSRMRSSCLCQRLGQKLFGMNCPARRIERQAECHWSRRCQTPCTAQRPSKQVEK